MLVAEIGLLKNPIPLRQSVHTMCSQPMRSDYRLHSHDCYELLFIARGSGYRTIGRHRGHFRPGELVLLAPDVPHSWYTDGPLFYGARLDVHVLWFAPRLVEESLNDVPETADLSALLSKARRGVAFGKETVSKSAGLIRDIQEEAGPNRLGVMYILLARLARSTDTQLLNPTEVSNQVRSAELARVSGICEYLQTHFADALTLQSVARHFQVSASTLNGLLRRNLRQTFLQYLTRLRLEEARRMLRSRADRITDVAFASGFNSLATFNRRFHREEGQSPLEYRRQHAGT